MPRPRIPVVLVAGFLGAGKTTVLNHLLRRNDGVRMGVLVNDFGAVDIDSMLVAGQVDSVVTLGNGCLCCAVDTEDLDEMFAVLTSARDVVDAIVVEASGVAEPRAMIRMVAASENERIRYAGMVMVVDAAEFEAVCARHPTIASHLAMADLVVVNKADRVSAAELDAVRVRIETLVPQTPVLVTAHGAVDVRVLFDPPERSDDGPRQLTLDDLLREADDHHDHLHAEYQTVSVSTDRYLDPRAFVEFLENPPVGLYRSKGFARFGSGPGTSSRALVHTVGRHIDMEPAPSRRGTDLVFIGAGLDVDETERTVTSMVRDRPATEEELLVVHRYLRTPVTDPPIR